MTRDRLRPSLLVRKVLLPPVVAGALVACLLAVLAATAANGSKARAGNPLGGAGTDSAARRRVVTALSADLEGEPAPRDIRRARKPLPERLRLLARHPYFALYVRAQHRYSVPWVLVASIHYQETGFERSGSQADAVMAIARRLRAAHASKESLGDVAMRAVSARYGATPEGRVSTAMVVERARAWRLLGTIPKRGRGELATPVAGIVGGCGYFGCPRPGHLHNGVDFLAPAGVPVHAADGGRVALVQAPDASGGYGNFVCLQHRPHLATCYAHLSAIAAHVRVGARVRRGEVIGLVGSTGHSSAPHLHFEARLGPAACQSCAVDPLPMLSGDVPQRRVPRMLRASANAGSVAAAAIGAPQAGAARAGAAQAGAAQENIEIAPREPAPLIPITPSAPAATPAARNRRPAPAHKPAAPTGGASVESTPAAPARPATPVKPAAPAPPAARPKPPKPPKPAAPAAPAASPEGGASPTTAPAAPPS
ncbi:MAG: hypothetical protein QOE31_1260 [Solirubrobacteraceae bacterium]|nr:hypothetical protein [Solirubrobacteraceae bacterium]